jgi:hypothetical protein
MTSFKDLAAIESQRWERGPVLRYVSYFDVQGTAIYRNFDVSSTPTHLRNWLDPWVLLSILTGPVNARSSGQCSGAGGYAGIMNL